MVSGARGEVLYFALLSYNDKRKFGAPRLYFPGTVTAADLPLMINDKKHRRSPTDKHHMRFSRFYDCQASYVLNLYALLTRQLLHVL